MTWDHIIPVSWYPDLHAPNVEKWKVPSCVACNNRLSKIEKDMLIRIGMCLDPEAPESKSIVEKALRSVLPQYASSAKEAQHRENKRRQLLEQMIPGGEIRGGVYPGFGLPIGASADDHYALSFPKRHVDQIGSKMMRGIAFRQYGKILPPHAYEIGVQVLSPETSAQILSQLAPHVEVHAFAPGLTMKRAITPEDPAVGIYAFTIWGRFEFFGSILPKGAQLESLRLKLPTDRICD